MGKRRSAVQIQRVQSVQCAFSPRRVGEEGPHRLGVQLEF